MTGQPPESNIGISLHGTGSIDMWTGSTRSVGQAVAGVGQDLGSSIPGLLAKIDKAQEDISANITGNDETSRKYMEQENLGYHDYEKAVKGFPARVAAAADECFAAVDEYVASDDRIAQHMGTASDPRARPGP